MTTPIVDHEIVSLLLSQQDETQRSIVIQEIRVKLQRVARYKGIPEKDIDDVVNDGIEKLLRKLPKFHGRGPLNHWITVLFGNHCIDYFRRRSRERQIFDNFPVSDIDNGNDSYLEFIPDHTSNTDIQADSQRRLELVIAILDKVIQSTASLRRNTDRDALIANLGLKDLLEPNEIHEKLMDQYPGLTMNAIRIVLHEFRAVLRKEFDDSDD